MLIAACQSVAHTVARVYIWRMRAPKIRLIAQCLTIGASLIAMSKSVPAQASATTVLDFTTGSQFEDYLRALQIVGQEPLQPWSIRGFAPRVITELAGSDSTGPWTLRKNFRNLRLTAGPLELGTIFNSSYPYGANDGPVWAGRGLTVVAAAGISGHAGPFSFTLRPKAFSAANRS